MNTQNLTRRGAFTALIGGVPTLPAKEISPEEKEMIRRLLITLRSGNRFAISAVTGTLNLMAEFAEKDPYGEIASLKERG